MKKYIKISAVLLLTSIFLTGCNAAAPVVVDANLAMTPVDSYNTKQVREYTDAGTIEEPRKDVFL